MSARPDPLIGSVIAGRYEVVRVIGKGGMGTIYEVVNTRLGRSFALKTLASGAEAETLARFRREAEIVAKLTHPNILDVVDWDTLADGSPCMVMEYLRGEDLAERIKAHGPLAWPDYARIADQVLAALSVAHRAGVVHRDLKPQNIFLAADDNGDERVKLLDFGISKLRDARNFTTTDAKVMGTPAYMPPEQAEGRQDDIGPATDVWAMGTILYEMATGTTAFAGPSIPAILYRVVHGRPEPVTALRSDIPPALVQVIDRALTVDLAARTSNVDQLRSELRAALSHIDGVSWPEPLRARTGPVMTPRHVTIPAGLKVAGPVAMAETIAPGATPAAAAPTAIAADAPVAAVPRRTSRALVGAIAAAALVAGVGVVVLTRGSGSHAAAPSAPAPAPAPAPSQPAAAAAPVAPPAKPDPVETPAPAAHVHVVIDSSPAGADLYRLPSEVKVGVTPWSVDVDRVDGAGVFVVKKAGYVDARVEIDLRTGGEQQVTLARTGAVAASTTAKHGTATAASATPTTTPTPDGRKKGEPIDPFSKRKKGEPVDPFGSKQ